MAGFSLLIGTFVQVLLDTGAIDNIYAITGSITMPHLNTPWLAHLETGGCTLLFVGCYLIDLMLWYMSDKPCSIYTNMIHREDLHLDDVSAFQIRFAKGIIAQCFVSQSESTVCYENNIRGRNGKLNLRGRGFLQFEISISSKTLAVCSAPTIIRPTVKHDNIQSRAAVRNRLIWPEILYLPHIILGQDVESTSPFYFPRIPADLPFQNTSWLNS